MGRLDAGNCARFSKHIGPIDPDAFTARSTLTRSSRANHGLRRSMQPLRTPPSSSLPPSSILKTADSSSRSAPLARPDPKSLEREIPRLPPPAAPSVRMGCVFAKPNRSRQAVGCLASRESMSDSIAEVLADDAYAIKASDEWIAIAVG